MRTFRQASMSSPSRFVSTLRSSMVRLSTPVASTAKCPPFRTEKSRSRTLRHSSRAIALSPWPSTARSGAASGSSPAPTAVPMLSGRSPRLSRPAGTRSTAGEARSIDAPRPDDGHVLEPDAPDQAVLPVGVAKVLREVVLVRLRRIVAAPLRRRRGREQRSARAELERDAALQPDGVARVRARGQVHGAAPGTRRSLDGGVDRLRVEGLAVASRSEGTHVEDRPGRVRGENQASRECGEQGTQSEGGAGSHLGRAV
jgi:hypothetical protein